MDLAGPVTQASPKDRTIRATGEGDSAHLTFHGWPRAFGHTGYTARLAKHATAYCLTSSTCVAQVKIIAKDFYDDTTSFGAGGLWKPYSLGMYPDTGAVEALWPWGVSWHWPEMLRFQRQLWFVHDSVVLCACYMTGF